MPTFIQTRPEDTEVQLSLLTVMDCVVHHDPAVTVQVVWYHNSVPIDPDATSRVNLLPSGSLEITQARRSDKGAYECVVTSVAGDDRASATLTILGEELTVDFWQKNILKVCMFLFVFLFFLHFKPNPVFCIFLKKASKL